MTYKPSNTNPRVEPREAWSRTFREKVENKPGAQQPCGFQVPPVDKP